MTPLAAALAAGWIVSVVVVLAFYRYRCGDLMVDLALERAHIVECHRLLGRADEVINEQNEALNACHQRIDDLNEANAKLAQAHSVLRADARLLSQRLTFVVSAMRFGTINKN